VKTCSVCGSEWPDDTKFCPNDGTTLHAAAAGADLIGSIIADKFHIEKKLGEGGMGTVYLAEHVKMRRKSAIKVMAQSMASDPEAIARFNREATTPTSARSMTSARHPTGRSTSRWSSSRESR
jgi:serine/threonine-protein kinase